MFDIRTIDSFEPDEVNQEDALKDASKEVVEKISIIWGSRRSGETTAVDGIVIFTTYRGYQTVNLFMLIRKDGLCKGLERDKSF